MKQLGALVSLGAAAMLAVLLLAADPAHAQDSVPQHARLASFGVILGLRGEAPSTDGLPVQLGTGVSEGLQEPVFRYEGYLVSGVQVEDLAQIEDTPNAFRLLGVVIFEDAAARRVYTEFAAYYSTSDTGVTVTWATARTRTPENPTVVWFAVDADDVPADTRYPTDHIALLQRLEAKALKAPPANIADGTIVYAVAMDRFAADTQPLFSSKARSISVKTLNLGGWPVGVFEGAMDASTIADDAPLEMRSPSGALYSRLTTFPTKPEIFE